MPGLRMVHLVTVPSAFQARVIAARLGSDGILTQLRGAVGGPYPVGEVSIYVSEEDAEVARELVLAEAGARPDGDAAALAAPPALAWAAVWVVLAVATCSVLARLL